MGAAHDEGVDAGIPQRLQILPRHRFNDGITRLEPAVLHQRHKQGARLTDNGDIPVQSGDGALIGAGAHGGGSGDEPHPLVPRGRRGAEAGRLEHEARAYLRALATVQVITERERESFAAAIEDAVKARTAPAERTTFEHLHPDLKRHRETAKIYALGLALAEKCPPNDCRVYLNIFNAARELDAALDSLDADGAPALALRKALRERVGELAEMFDGNFAVKQYRKEARS